MISVLLYLIPMVLIIIWFIVFATMPRTPEAYRDFELPVNETMVDDETMLTHEPQEDVISVKMNQTGDKVILRSTGYYVNDDFTFTGALNLPPAISDTHVAYVTEQGFTVDRIHGDKQRFHIDARLPLFAVFDGLSLYVTTLSEEKAGMVTRYECIDGSWVIYQLIERPHSTPLDSFGRHVTVTDRVMLVTDAISVHMFYRPSRADEWSRIKSIYPPVGSPLLFGSQTALTRNACYIASPYETVDGMTYAGVVYVYSRLGGVWKLGEPMVSPFKQEEGRFGSSICVDGDLVWISDSRAAYAYRGDELVQTVSGETEVYGLGLAVRKGKIILSGDRRTLVS